MEKQTTNGSQPSIIVWDNLEEWVRSKVQEFIQSLLEEEITQLLGRQKSERRQAVDSLLYRLGPPIQSVSRPTYPYLPFSPPTFAAAAFLIIGLPRGSTCFSQTLLIRIAAEQYQAIKAQTMPS